MAGAHIVLTNKLRISRALIEANPQLQFVGVSATGTNNVDLDAARDNTVAVCNVREYCTPFRHAACPGGHPGAYPSRP